MNPQQTCDDYMIQIGDRSGGIELAPDTARALDLHLETCADCRQIEELANDPDAGDAEEAAADAAKIRARIDAYEAERARKRAELEKAVRSGELICEQTQPLLFGWLAKGELAPDTRRAVDGHLEGCAECRDVLDGIRTLDSSRFPKWLRETPEGRRYVDGCRERLEAWLAEPD